MNRPSDSIVFEAFTFSDMSSPELAQRVLQYILTSGEGFSPSSMGPSDPPDIPFSQANVGQAIDLLREGKSTDTARVGHIYLGTEQPPRVLYYLTWYRGPNPNFNQVRAEFPFSMVRDQQSVQSLLDFTRGLFELVDGIYGFIAHSAEWQAGHIRRRVLEPRVIQEKFVKFSPNTGLTGVYWANFFGPPYVSKYGRDLLERVVYHRKEFTARGTVLILTAPSPLDYAKPEARRLKEMIKQELGGDAFLDATIH